MQYQLIFAGLSFVCSWLVREQCEASPVYITCASACSLRAIREGVMMLVS